MATCFAVWTPKSKFYTKYDISLNTSRYLLPQTFRTPTAGRKVWLQRLDSEAGAAFTKSSKIPCLRVTCLNQSAQRSSTYNCRRFHYGVVWWVSEICSSRSCLIDWFYLRTVRYNIQCYASKLGMGWYNFLKNEYSLPEYSQIPSTERVLWISERKNTVDFFTTRGLIYTFP